MGGVVTLQPTIESMSRSELEALQLTRLQETLHRVYERVPFYHESFALAGVHPRDIRQLSDIRKLPFTIKGDLRSHYPFGLLAVAKNEVARYHGSSGTKGKPTVVAYTKKDLDMWSTIVARAIVTAGGRAGDIFHNAYGYGLFTGGLGLHAGAERLGMSVIPISGGNTPRQVTILEDFQPRGIAGTPSYILTMAEMMEAQGKDPRHTSLEYGIFGAEPWTEGMRRTLEEKLGIRAFDIYGLSEVIGPGVAMECSMQDGLHIAEDHFYVEVIDSKTGKPLEPGQIGELVFTSLTKEALPIIRYRTGDLASLQPEPCKCGRTHQRMSRIKGRVDDMIIVRGVNVFPTEIESIVLEHHQLTPNYQVVIERTGSLDRLTVRVEVSEQSIDLHGPVDSEAQQYQFISSTLAEALRNRLLISTHVELLSPKTLPRSEGKAVRMIDQRQL